MNDRIIPTILTISMFLVLIAISIISGIEIYRSKKSTSNNGNNNNNGSDDSDSDDSSNNNNGSNSNDDKQFKLDKDKLASEGAYIANAYPYEVCRESCVDDDKCRYFSWAANDDPTRASLCYFYGEGQPPQMQDSPGSITGSRI